MLETTLDHVDLGYSPCVGFSACDTLPDAAPMLSLLAVGASAVGGCTIPDTDVPLVFSDQHDGDFKAIAVKDLTLTITPYNNTETWKITAGPLDDDCSVRYIAPVAFLIGFEPAQVSECRHSFRRRWWTSTCPASLGRLQYL